MFEEDAKMCIFFLSTPLGHFPWPFPSRILSDKGAMLVKVRCIEKLLNCLK